MLIIRLQRAGKKNSPDFRIILAESTAAAGKKFNEILGAYNPRTKAFKIKDQARVEYWLGQRVQMSPTVHNLFVTHKLLQEKKRKAFSVPKKPESAPVAVQAENKVEAAKDKAE